MYFLLKFVACKRTHEGKSGLLLISNSWTKYVRHNIFFLSICLCAHMTILYLVSGLVELENFTFKKSKQKLQVPVDPTFTGNEKFSKVPSIIQIAFVIVNWIN